MKNISRMISDAQTIAVTVHRNPDGDCLGSAAALVIALRSIGKEAYVFCSSPIPERLRFIAGEEFQTSFRDSWDLCIAVDVAEDYMMEDVFETVFSKADATACIDHHKTNKGYADVNYVDGEASAAGEIIFDFICNFLDVEITAEIAERLYAAIASDTGSFRYSNTTWKTHHIVSELLKTGFDSSEVMYRLFEKKSASQLALHAEVVSNLKFYENGKICMAYVDSGMLRKYSMTFDEADDLATLPRTIDGVEVGVYIKVRSDNECKVSLRSNKYVDVSEVAALLGGGGHLRASGLTVNDTLEKTIEILHDAIKKVI